MPVISIPKIEPFLQSFVQVFHSLYLSFAGYLYHSSSLLCPPGVKSHFLPLTDLKVPISIAQWLTLQSHSWSCFHSGFASKCLQQLFSHCCLIVFYGHKRCQVVSGNRVSSFPADTMAPAFLPSSDHCPSFFDAKLSQTHCLSLVSLCTFWHNKPPLPW